LGSYSLTKEPYSKVLPKRRTKHQ